MSLNVPQGSDVDRFLAQPNGKKQANVKCALDSTGYDMRLL
jgi:hypothetical protein